MSTTGKRIAMCGRHGLTERHKAARNSTIQIKDGVDGHGTGTGNCVIIGLKCSKAYTE